MLAIKRRRYQQQETFNGDYFTITPLTSGYLYIKFLYTIEFTYNDGSSWNNIGADYTSTGYREIPVTPGSVYKFRGDASQIDGFLVRGDGINNRFLAGTATFAVSGCPLSLTLYEGFRSPQAVPYCSYDLWGLFRQNTSLISADGLILPEDFGSYRYVCARMFDGCTNLTTGPTLPAATLAEGCYSQMFNDCSSLNYVKCLATDITATNCTASWMAGAQNSASCEFVKAASMSSWPRTTSGIPNLWTVSND